MAGDTGFCTRRDEENELVNQAGYRPDSSVPRKTALSVRRAKAVRSLRRQRQRTIAFCGQFAEVASAPRFAVASNSIPGNVIIVS